MAPSPHGPISTVCTLAECGCRVARRKKHLGQRTVHHAVSGVVLRGGHVLLFVHENVPSIIEPWQPPGIVRYAVPEADFSRWTACGLRLLRTMSQERVKACAFGGDFAAQGHSAPGQSLDAVATVVAEPVAKPASPSIASMVSLFA